MRKFLKIAGLLVLSLVVLLGIATTILRLAFPPARLRRLVQEEIRQKFHREAQIGPVNLGVFGISAERLRLSDVPNFQAGTFLYVQQAQIRWALAPLLRRKLVIEKVVLKEPQINLVRMADGKTLNISDLENGPESQSAVAPTKISESPVRRSAETPLRPGAGKAWSWVVQRIDLNQGGIRFDDQSAAHQMSSLSKIDLTLRNLTANTIQGNLAVGRLENPAYSARDLSAEWSLRAIDPSLAHVNGSIHLRQGPGAIQNLAALAATSTAAKLVFMPILMLQNLDRLGLLRLGLPDFSRLVIDGIAGNYVFKDGVMTIETFWINGPQLAIDSQGTVQLATGVLNVNVELQAPKRSLLGETNLKMHLSGTWSHPQADLKDLKKKAFKATVNSLLQSPKTLEGLDKTLKQIFH